MDLLEKYLYELDVNLKDDISSISLDAIIDNIIRICNNIDREVDHDLAMHLLFISETPISVLSFCCKLDYTQDNKTKVVSLKFLASYIKTLYNKGYERIVNQYSQVIFQKLFNYFIKEDSKSLKANALLPIKYILRYYAIKNVQYNSTITILHIDDLIKVYKILLSTLINKKENKQNKTLKSEIFRTLGLLIAVYSTSKETLQFIDQILTQIYHYLHMNFSPDSKEPEFPCMAGALSCLDRCMFEFEDKVLNTFKKLAVGTDGQALLCKYLLQSVSSANMDDVYRYELPSKALRVISHHSFLFQNLITSNARTSYDVIENCRKEKSNSKKISKHCTDALCAILTQLASGVASNVSSNKTENDSTETLNKLCSDFLGKLTGSYDDITLAVMGIAAIAPGIAKSASNQSRMTRIMESLLKAANFKKDLENDNENIYYVKYHYVSKSAHFLKAFAYIISSSDIVPDTNVFKFIVTASMHVLRGFDVLQMKFKLSFCCSMCMIIHGLTKQTSLQVQFIGEFLYDLILNTVKRSEVNQPNGIDEDEEIEDLNLGESQVNTFMLIWYEILNPSTNKETMNALNVAGPPEYSTISTILFDRIMLMVLDIIQKLDLQVSLLLLSSS